MSVPVFLKKLDALTERGAASEKSALVLINDGSADETWQTIVSLRTQDRRIVGIDMARNAGEQNALLAGLSYAASRADCAITMDSDLQDDIDAVDEMLARYASGDELVLGVRSGRKDDPFTERLASGLFYRLMALAGTGQIREHANYRLMSRRAIGLLLQHKETNYYLPCVVSNMGLRRSAVYHERFPRAAGSSGYTIVKKLRLALDAVVAHSRLPLKLITCAACFCALLFVACLIAAFAVGGETRLCLWALCAAFLIGALLLFAVRVGAEYAYKAFQEARAAPRWQIGEILDGDQP